MGLGKILVSGKSIYPSGYQYKIGNLVSASKTVTIPNGCIPLAFTVSQASFSTFKGETQTLEIKITDNLGKVYASAWRTGAGEVRLNNCCASIGSLYQNKFDMMKQIKSITHTFVHVPSMYNEQYPGVITVTEWLEKSGGGVLNPLDNKWYHFLKKGGIKHVG